MVVGRVDITKENNKQWYFAVGGYNAAGLAKWKCKNDKYTMDFSFNFSDRYNWDADKAVELNNKIVPDVELGRLHQVGIAKEYNMKGKAKREISWKKAKDSMLNQVN